MKSFIIGLIMAVFAAIIVPLTKKNNSQDGTGDGKNSQSGCMKVMFFICLAILAFAAVVIVIGIIES